jgi:RsmE family RNA methyltransferase
MNLLLLNRSDLIAENKAEIFGEKVRHLNEILKLNPGNEVRVGILNGKKGKAVIEKIETEKAVLSFELYEDPLPKIPLSVIVALARPKVLSRLVSDLVSYGVEGIEIIQTYFGDKGYWENELFTESGLAEAVGKGLEQSMDTIPPKISLVKRFGPYSNDILPEYSAKSNCYIALPGDFPKIGEIEKGKSNIIAIGPERGWTKYEAAQFIKAGFQPVSLGNRVVRTEAAVHACVAHFI